MEKGFIEQATDYAIKSRKVMVNVWLIMTIVLLFIIPIIIYISMGRSYDAAGTAVVMGFLGIFFIPLVIYNFIKYAKLKRQKNDYGILNLYGNEDKNAAVRVINEEMRTKNFLFECQPYEQAKLIKYTLTPSYFIFYESAYKISAYPIENVYSTYMRVTDTTNKYGRIISRDYSTAILCGKSEYFIPAKSREDVEETIAILKNNIPNLLISSDEKHRKLFKKNHDEFLKIHRELLEKENLNI